MPNNDRAMAGSEKRFFLLFPLGLLCMVLSMHPIAAMCYVILTARHWLADERPKAWGIVGLSSLVAVIVMGSLGLGVFYGTAGSMGCLLGVLTQRQWSYSHRLWVMTGGAFFGSAALVLSAWQTMRHDWTIFWNARIAEMEAQSNVNEPLLEVIRWYDVNYIYIGIGSLFASLLLMVAYVLCIVERGYQKENGQPTRRTTGFQRMRLPDWLVWVVIVVALLWFAEQRWPNEALRIVAWNSAVALTGVYWLNGLSILFYALTIMKVSALATVAIVSGMVVFGLMQLLGMMGLFDTWYDFRLRIRRLALLRQVARSTEDGDE